MREEPVLFKVAELEPDGGGGEGECRGHRGGIEGTLALQQVEDGPARGGQLLERRLGFGSLAGTRRLDGHRARLHRIGMHRIGVHGSIRWTSPNSCHRYPSSSAAA